MTDYLEELLDQAGALLEQVRRLERSKAGREALAEEAEELSACSAPEGCAAVPGPAEGAGFAPETASRRREAVSGPGAETVGESSSAGWQAAPDAPGGASAPLEERRRSAAPLREQLERLDRAAAASRQAAEEPRREGEQGISLSGPGRNFAGWPEGAEETRPGMTGPGYSEAGGEQDWAELTDRAFRRDSRRYDGGFYLY